MPGVQEPKKDSERKRHFITEKIVKQPLTRRQIIRRFLALCFCAVVFGVIAGASFLLTQSFIAARLMKPEETEGTTISFSRDEPPEVTETAEPTTEPVSETETVTESEPVEDLVQDALERYHFTVDDLNQMIGGLRSQIQAVNRGIVVVHSVHQDTDWFDNPVETSGQYAGAVIARTPQELVIMTPEHAVEHADSIKVTFGNGQEVDGRMKQKDSISGLAIVSVNLEELEEDTRDNVKELVLGNSYKVREGDLVVAVGGPSGMVYSVDYGVVSYISKNTQMVDRINRVIYTDVSTNVVTGTFLVNTAGELIGWAMEPRQEAEGSSRRMAEVMGISDYKAILEKLTNGLGAPYFGIEGQEVPEVLTEQGRPQGIYVTNTLADGPAYSAGIQNGDIITKVDDKEPRTMAEFQNLVDNLECGQLVHVVVRRDGRDEYAKLEFQITVGAR
ncbi:MAG: PDZ domain-containing protein [Lachnospiraceae bacterium]|nr:PDZ domain-containing protein [Lachnospiraceae bacterium]